MLSVGCRGIDLTSKRLVISASALAQPQMICRHFEVGITGVNGCRFNEQQAG